MGADSKIKINIKVLNLTFCSVHIPNEPVPVNVEGKTYKVYRKGTISNQNALIQRLTTTCN